MLKTYKIKDVKKNEVSSKKVSIQYLLEDNEGCSRTVMAIGEIGLRKKVKSIKPVYHRETPLVEALSRTSIDDVVCVDFSEFNKKNPRISIGLTNSQKNGRLSTVNNSKPNYISNMLEINVFRLVQLFIVSSVGFVAFLAI